MRRMLCRHLATARNLREIRIFLKSRACIETFIRSTQPDRHSPVTQRQPAEMIKSKPNAIALGRRGRRNQAERRRVRVPERETVMTEGNGFLLDRGSQPRR